MVGLCIQQGVVSDQPQAVDSASIKAYASMSRLQPKCSGEANTLIVSLQPRRDGMPLPIQPVAQQASTYYVW